MGFLIISRGLFVRLSDISPYTDLRVYMSRVFLPDGYINHFENN